jgi:hypothetical protein
VDEAKATRPGHGNLNRFPLAKALLPRLLPSGNFRRETGFAKKPVKTEQFKQ